MTYRPIVPVNYDYNCFGVPSPCPITWDRAYFLSDQAGEWVWVMTEDGFVWLYRSLPCPLWIEIVVQLPRKKAS